MPALDGRTVLVTGASTGIGRTTALMLAELGATVLAGVRNTAAGEALGPTVRAVQLDITDPDDIAALDLSRLDALVNNAGIAISGPLEFLPVAELRHQLEVNVIAQLAVTQACLPALRASKGRIVNISSIAGRVAWANYGVYNMTKFGVNGFTEALRQEVTKKHVRVGVLEPGAVDTELVSHNNETVKSELAASDAIAEPLQPDDIADNIAFMVTRPRRSSIAELWAMPTSQA